MSTALKAAATGTTGDPSKDLMAMLEKHKGQIAAALPRHLTPDRMMRLTLTAFNQSEQLRKCETRSVFAAVVVASQLGLEIGIGGQGYMVPYKGKATFIPGWQGLVDLVSRAGRATVWTGAVFEGDEFDYALGDAPYIKHRPCGEDNPQKMTHTYAVGRVNNSQWPVIEVWPVKRLKTHRDKNNKVGSSHYSFEHWEMYCRKVPLLQVLKYMPKSIELSTALAVEGAYEEGKNITVDGSFAVVTEEPAAETTQPGGAPAAAAPAAQQSKVHQPVSFAWLKGRLEGATDKDTLDMDADLIREVESAADQDTLREIYKNRITQLNAKKK